MWVWIFHVDLLVRILDAVFWVRIFFCGFWGADFFRRFCDGLCSFLGAEFFFVFIWLFSRRKSPEKIP